MKYLSGCTGKIPYISEQDAVAEARKFKKRIPGLVRVYCCHYLSFGQVHWHITTMSKRQVRNVKKRKAWDYSRKGKRLIA